MLTNQPKSYYSFDNGTDIIQIINNLPFTIGNIIKYTCRLGLKTDDITQDLTKIKDYLRYADTYNNWYQVQSNIRMSTTMLKLSSTLQSNTELFKDDKYRDFKINMLKLISTKYNNRHISDMLENLVDDLLTTA